MPEEVSLLIISKDQASQVIELMRNLHTHFKDCVVIDSSSKSEFARLQTALGDLDKVRVEWLPSLGFVEPYREYGMRLCTGDWVFNLDADELPNKALAENICDIVSDLPQAGILRVRRIFYLDGVRHEGNVMAVFRDFVPRLFRKGAVEFSGYPHERPRTNMRMVDLPHNLSISHHHSMDTGLSRLRKYITVDLTLHRLTYKQLIDELPTARLRALAGRTLPMLAKLRGQSVDDLVDLTTLSFLKRVERVMANRSVLHLNLDPYWRVEIGAMRMLSPETSAMTERLSREVYNSGGLIRFLGLDTSIGFKRLGELEGMTRCTGVSLLIRAVIEHLKKRHPSVEQELNPDLLDSTLQHLFATLTFDETNG